ncbi:MAG: 1,4-dihydroxy-2-naphthoate octaprenyltransferase [Puniceicoccaceae bacterium]|nr:1,4-dihydroxy-2-naphthoate octaprenyltransferase [Puniceicoccaceae bacterium]RCL31944.1 MAG: 1,4-dihydroxy-2-naphthoate octaprenyltransferase [Puniceicoccaceae bacterium]
MHRLLYWIEAARLNTLSASLTPVLIGASYAYHKQVFQVPVFIYCLAFALLCQIGSNFANDYLDYEKGADSSDRTGPARAVASGKISAGAMRLATGLTLGLAFSLGLMLIPYGGYGLLIIGIASVFFAWAYTGGPYPLAYNGLGDLFVILFFGLIAVSMSFYLHGLIFDSLILLNAFSCGLFINNLLVINNLRDCDADRACGKRTSIVRLGRVFGRNCITTACFLAALTAVINAITIQSSIALIALIPPLLTWWSLKAIHTFSDPRLFYSALKKTGLFILLYGICIGLGFMI